MIRNHSQQVLEQFAAYSRVPVINGLTERLHPCQLLADIQTSTEHCGDIAKARVAWVGDGNNMCHSWINAARILGFELRLATPTGYAPAAALVRAAGDCVQACDSAAQAVADADLVVTRSEEHTSELQSRFDLVCRLLLEKKNTSTDSTTTHE